jgi:DNA polymerase III epsilon subunit-like protein
LTGPCVMYKIITRPYRRSRLLARRFAKSASLVYLDVDFEDRHTVKQLGAQWDSANKKWFVPANTELSHELLNWKRQYLSVPLTESSEVKNRGALWNWRKGQWYITGNLDERNFKQWIIPPKERNTKDSSRHYLVVPSRDYKEVAALGGKWDVLVGKWYVHHDKVAIEKFQKWPQLDISNSESSDELSLSVEGSDNNNCLQEGSDRSSAVVIFDIETTGLPEKGKDYKDLARFESCRIVQMSCMLCNRHTLEPIDSCDIIVKSDGFPIDNSTFHGISLERSLQEGKSFEAAVDELMSLFNRASVLIAHNATFDVTVLKSELHRYNLTAQIQALDLLQVYCSMIALKTTINSVNINGKQKFPSLKDLYTYAVGKDITNQHNAMYDVENLREALSVLVRKGEIQV